MEKYGLQGHGNDFIKSDLSNSLQKGKVNKVQSEIFKYIHDELQSSVMELLLLIELVNDFSKITKRQKPTMFIDDNSCLCSGATNPETVNNG